MINPNKNKKIAFFVYTNSDYFDILYPCIKRIRKYLPKVKLYVAANKNDDLLNKFNAIHIEYDNEKIYSNRMYDSLLQIKDDYIVYMHEDMILYKSPDYKKIVDLANIMHIEKIDFIRFCINDGTQVKEEIAGTNLRSYDGEYYFSVQPSIWNVNSLRQFMKHENKNIWDLELYSQNTCKTNYKAYTYSTLNENKKGLGHKESIIFPYIATAITKGKWNTLEYKDELTTIFNEYSIDQKIRGTNEY